MASPTIGDNTAFEAREIQQKYVYLFITKNQQMKLASQTLLASQSVSNLCSGTRNRGTLEAG